MAVLFAAAGCAAGVPYEISLTSITSPASDCILPARGWLGDLMAFPCSSVPLSTVSLPEVLHQTVVGGYLPGWGEPLGRDMLTAAIPKGTL